MNRYLKHVLLYSATACLAYYFIVIETFAIRDIVTLYTQAGAVLIEALTGDTLRVVAARVDGLGRIFNDGAGSDGTFIYISAESDIAFLLIIMLFTILFRGACSLNKVLYMSAAMVLLLALNILRIGLMYIVMAYQPLYFDAINVIVLPGALLLVAAALIFIWNKANCALLTSTVSGA